MLDNPHPSFSPILALFLASCVALAAMFTPRFTGVQGGRFFPPSFVTHTVMLGLSLGLMGLLSKGRMDLFGLAWGLRALRPSILLWILPTAAMSVASAFWNKGAHGHPALELSKLQFVLFVCIYASLAEEVLTRGLLQTLLGWNAQVASILFIGLSLPVLLSGLFFGAMHLGLLRTMKAGAIPIVVLTTCLGIVAARYREKTGSLLPAILIHMGVNVGGLIPAWIIDGLRG
jgi:membrane protease YdiL (CAAX protease family)